jgi:hypothetical protein
MSWAVNQYAKNYCQQMMGSTIYEVKDTNLIDCAQLWPNPGTRLSLSMLVEALSTSSHLRHSCFSAPTSLLLTHPDSIITSPTPRATPSQIGAMATYAPAQPAQPPAQQEKIKPMTNNKKDKETPPSPPMKIRDQGNGLQYTRMGFLGEVSAWRP